MFCDNCGNKVSSIDNFCTSCGNKLSYNSEHYNFQNHYISQNTYGQLPYQPLNYSKPKHKLCLFFAILSTVLSGILTLSVFGALLLPLSIISIVFATKARKISRVEPIENSKHLAKASFILSISSVSICTIYSVLLILAFNNDYFIY